MACFSIGPTSGDFPGSYDVIHLMGGSADYWGLTTLFPYTTLFRSSEERRVGKECIVWLVPTLISRCAQMELITKLS